MWHSSSVSHASFRRTLFCWCGLVTISRCLPSAFCSRHSIPRRLPSTSGSTIPAISPPITAVVVVVLILCVSPFLLLLLFSPPLSFVLCWGGGGGGGGPPVGLAY